MLVSIRKCDHCGDTIAEHSKYLTVNGAVEQNVREDQEYRKPFSGEVCGISCATLLFQDAVQKAWAFSTPPINFPPPDDFDVPTQ